MENTDNTDNKNEECLSEMFDSGFKLFNNLTNTEEPTNSLKVQIDVKKCIKLLEDATKLVSIADIFSTNESFDEIPTEHIKYYLLPALLGTLATKLCDRDNRMHNVEVSEIYFYDFLERVKSYDIINIDIPKKINQYDNNDDKNLPSSSKELSINKNDNKINTKMIESMVNTRKNKLEKYKEEKELKDKLKILENNMNNENIDDETKRNYFTTLIKLYALQAIDEINSLSQEKEILKHMAKIKIDGNNDDKVKKFIQPKLKPIIITRNDVQKKVYGAGYPSLPVMTVSEFYEKKVADGEWPAGGEPGTTIGGKALTESTSAEGEYKEAQEDPDKLEKEKNIEEDSEEYLAQTRAMDEYKDTHKRGWGNRYNRS